MNLVKDELEKNNVQTLFKHYMATLKLLVLDG